MLSTPILGSTGDLREHLGQSSFLQCLNHLQNLSTESHFHPQCANKKTEARQGSVLLEVTEAPR